MLVAPVQLANIPVTRVLSANASNVSATNALNRTAPAPPFYVFAGVQETPEGCLVLYGETLTPVSFSLLSTVLVQLTLAVIAVVNDRHRNLYFSAHSLRLSVFTVAYLASHFVHFFYIAYAVSRLPPTYARFSTWHLYTLLYIRVWNSGFFAAAFAPVFVWLVYEAFKDPIRDLIDEAEVKHWSDIQAAYLATNGGRSSSNSSATASSSPAMPPADATLVVNPLRRLPRASVRQLSIATPPSRSNSVVISARGSAVRVSTSARGSATSLGSKASMRNLLGVASERPAAGGLVAAAGRANAGRRSGSRDVFGTTPLSLAELKPAAATPVAATGAGPPKRSAKFKLPCCKRHRNWVPPDEREAYWRKGPVSRQTEYRMWRQWAYGKRDELVPIFPGGDPGNPFVFPTPLTPGALFSRMSLLLFLSLLLMLLPSLLTHIVPMAVFFILSLPAACAVALVVVYVLKLLLDLLKARGWVPPFGPDPRAVPAADRARLGLYILVSVLWLCLPTFFLGLTLLTLFYHGVILYAAGTPIDYFGVTRTWWQLTNLRCFFVGLVTETSVFDPTGGLSHILLLLSYIV